MIRLLVKNKIFLFLSTRYLTYFVQFIVSMVVALKLGPYYFGIWGFLLLLLNYLQLFNFGISHAMNVLLVQYKDDVPKRNQYVVTSFFLTGILAFLIILFAIYYFAFDIPIFEKYQGGWLVYLVCVIGICSHFNNLFMVIYRVNNRVYEISFYQSIVVALTFISLFIATDRILLIYLLFAYIIGHLLAILVFTVGKVATFSSKPDMSVANSILKKGKYLFIYNISFYFIVIATRSIISYFYTVEEFGYFTFAFNIANAILLFLEGFTFLVLPKVIDRLSSPDSTAIKYNLKFIRTNFVTLSQGFMYVAMVVFPLFLSFFPKYKGTLEVLNLTTLTLLAYTNGEGYGAYLMAQNREKTISALAFTVLVLNISIALFLAVIIKTSYSYVILASLISYFIYVYFLVLFSKRRMGDEINMIQVFLEAFPLRLFIPYTAACVMTFFEFKYGSIIVLIVFILLNYKLIGGIKDTIWKIVYKPDVINI